VYPDPHTGVQYVTKNFSKNPPGNKSFSRKRKFSRNDILRKLSEFSLIFVFRENEPAKLRVYCTVHEKMRKNGMSGFPLADLYIRILRTVGDSLQKFYFHCEIKFSKILTF
jgi:hypothetical protein